MLIICNICSIECRNITNKCMLHRHTAFIITLEICIAFIGRCLATITTAGIRCCLWVHLCKFSTDICDSIYDIIHVIGIDTNLVNLYLHQANIYLSSMILTSQMILVQYRLVSVGMNMTR